MTGIRIRFPTKAFTDMTYWLMDISGSVHYSVWILPSKQYMDLLQFEQPSVLRAIPFEILRGDGLEKISNALPHILFFSRTPSHIFCNSPPPPAIFYWHPQEHFYVCIFIGKNTIITSKNLILELWPQQEDSPDHASWAWSLKAKYSWGPVHLFQMDDGVQ